MKMYFGELLDDKIEKISEIHLRRAKGCGTAGRSKQLSTIK